VTEKQKRFCDEYLIDLNATQAAIRAGYSPNGINKRVSRMMANDGIQEYIKKRLAEKEDALIAKQDEVLQTLTRVLRRQEMDTVVVTCKERRSGYDENGKKVIVEKEVPQLVQVPTRVSDLNKAAELLGKRYGLYAEKVDLDADAELHICIDYGESSE
jgi:phage terminase small subunit